LKQLIYSIPPILYGSILTMLIDSGAGSVSPVGYIALLLMSACSLLLIKGKWWGAAFGFAAGLIFTALGFRDTAYLSIIREYVIGIPLCIFYIVCAFICFLDEKQRRNPPDS